MSDNKVRVGITQGDINGINYEVIIKTFQDPRVLEFCTPVLYGSPKVAAYHRKALNVSNFNFNSVQSADEIGSRKANLINVLGDSIRVELGKSSQMSVEAAILSLEAAVKDLQANKIDVLVTTPVSRDASQMPEFNFKGHVPFLMDRFKAQNTMVIMTSELMKIGVVSGDVPFIEVPNYINEETIIKKLRLMNKALTVDFAIRKPRIAVLGLNPFSGDGGLPGKEETEIIIPTIEKANKEGILALGPFSADEFFGSGSFNKFDGILAMHHDQGVAPFKALNFDTGVNYFVGLPIICTSSDQGTEYEIAGLDQASPNAFREAVYMACNIFDNRKMHAELTKNPLPTYDVTD